MNAHQQITQLLSEKPMSKYDVMEVTGYAQRTAQKALKDLHNEGLIHIVDWSRAFHHPIPIYANGAGEDQPRPRPLTKTEVMRRLRKENPDYVERERMRKSMARKEMKRKRQALWLSIKEKKGPFAPFYDIARGSHA